DFTTQAARDDFTALKNAAGNLLAAQRDLRAAARLQAQMPALFTAVIGHIQAGECTALSSCLTAGTQLDSPLGVRKREELQAGGFVCARDENDRFGAVVAKVVEAVFERTGRILHLHGPNGTLIRTTPEHRYHEYLKGWVAAGTLAPGDVIRTDAGWINVEE